VPRMTASPAIAPARNRRYKRVAPPDSFHVTWQCPGIREICAATDLNMGGVFVLTDRVQTEGTTLKVKVSNQGSDILVNGIVRVAAQNGMGVEFVAIGSKERIKLDLLIKKFALSNPEESDRKNVPRPVKAAAAEEKSTGPPQRKFPRVNLPKGLKVAWTHEKQRELTIAGTVSSGGLFVISRQPAPVGSQVRLLFDIPGGEVLATAVVRNHVAGRGMGVEFTEIQPADRTRLEGLLQRLLN